MLEKAKQRRSQRKKNKRKKIVALNLYRSVSPDKFIDSERVKVK